MTSADLPRDPRDDPVPVPRAGLRRDDHRPDRPRGGRLPASPLPLLQYQGRHSRRQPGPVRASPDGHDQRTAAEASVREALRAGVAAVLALHESREQALERFRLLHNTPSLHAGWLEKRLRFEEDLLPLIEARMGATAGSADARARAVTATAFACLDAASMTWVDNDGKGNIMDL
nr:hypothetical protein [Nocardia brevicatena]